MPLIAQKRLCKFEIYHTAALYQIALQFDGIRKALPCSAKGFEPQHTESEARNLFSKPPI